MVITRPPSSRSSVDNMAAGGCDLGVNAAFARSELLKEDAVKSESDSDAELDGLTPLVLEHERTLAVRIP